MPDISKWNTQNVTIMAGLFRNCSSLSSLPDISKWNIKNVEYRFDMFKGTKNLKKIPEKFREEKKSCIIF